MSGSRAIRKLLVANRGEIAVRVFRTCRELGIETVAVAEPDDAGSLHARSAGETVAIASYLDPAEHVRAALETGADAVHPGYGFLSESASLAEAVEAAGLVWVGPPPDALRSGGDKLAAKRIAQEAGVPVVETGDADDARVPAADQGRGRAAAGAGCGSSAPRTSSTPRSRRRGARPKAAFGDDTVFFERYIESARHIEVQLLRDSHGHGDRPRRA